MNVRASFGRRRSPENLAILVEAPHGISALLVFLQDLGQEADAWTAWRYPTLRHPPRTKIRYSFASKSAASSVIWGIDCCPQLLADGGGGMIPTMGRDRAQQQDLFSTPAPFETPSPLAKQVSSGQKRRHVLLNDLPNAVRHLDDRELDLLITASLEEAKRRGRLLPNVQANKPDKSVQKHPMGKSSPRRKVGPVMDLHHPVNPLVIGRLHASGQRLALEDSVDTSVAVGRQLGDDRLDLCHEFVVGQRRPANPFLRSLSHAINQIGAGRLQSPAPRSSSGTVLRPRQRQPQPFF